MTIRCGFCNADFDTFKKSEIISEPGKFANCCPNCGICEFEKGAKFKEYKKQNKRVIKFRAWDKRNNAWIPQNQFILDSEGLYESWREFEDGISLCDDEYELMQYTGLKDKNSVHIYEGDILTSTIYPFQSDEEYNYHGEVSWGEEDAAFLLTKHVVNKDTRGISRGITDLLSDYDIRDFEVIGNIYENPELLTS